MRILLSLFIFNILFLSLATASPSRYGDPLPKFADFDDGGSYHARQIFHKEQEKYKAAVNAYSLECVFEYGLPVPLLYDPAYKNESVLKQQTELFDRKVSDHLREEPFKFTVGKRVEYCHPELYFFPEIAPNFYGEDLFPEGSPVEEDSSHLVAKSISYQAKIMVKYLWPNILHQSGYGLVDLDKEHYVESLKEGDLICFLNPLEDKEPLWGIFCGYSGSARPTVMMRTKDPIFSSYKNKIVEWGNGVDSTAHALVFRKNHRGVVPKGERDSEEIAKQLRSILPQKAKIKALEDSDFPSEEPVVPVFGSDGAQNEDAWKEELVKWSSDAKQISEAYRRFRVRLTFNPDLSEEIDNSSLLEDMTRRFDIGALFYLHMRSCGDMWHQEALDSTCLFEPYHRCGPMRDALVPCFACPEYEQTVKYLNEQIYFLSHFLEKIIAERSRSEDPETINRRMSFASENVESLLIFDRHRTMFFNTEEEKRCWTNRIEKTDLIQIFDKAGKFLMWSAFAQLDPQTFEPMVMIRRFTSEGIYQNELRYLYGIEGAHEVQLLKRVSGSSDGERVYYLTLP
ncbi:MAG: hypothetical protein HOK20_00175, partial [Alphaproteobacteria bacterium]|nr:hypothetical protein [Alphaproteobacteria bacterium]